MNSKVDDLLVGVLEGEWRSPDELEGIEEKQTPPIVAVICGDSRSQTNDVSYQPRNSVFHPSTIGNQVFGIKGSLAYPTVHIETVKLVLDIGHLRCGAVTHAAEMAEHTKPFVSGSDVQEVVQKTLDSFYSAGVSRKLLHTNGHEAIEEELWPMAQFFANAKQFLQGDEKPHLVKHAAANVYLQTAALLRMRHVQEKVKAGSLVVAGLLHDFTGRLGKKGNMYLVSYNGSSAGLETCPIAFSLNGCSNLILPQQKLFMKQ